LVSLYPISVFSSKLHIVLYSIKLGYYTHYYNTILCLIQIEIVCSGLSLVEIY